VTFDIGISAGITVSRLFETMIHSSRFDRHRGGLVRLAVGLALVAGSSGCELFDQSSSVDLNMFVAHHPRRSVDGPYPEFGFDEKPRTWVNDQGWEINMTEGYIVMTAASLIGCDGVEYPIDLDFGPVPEYINSTDLDVTIAGGVEIEEGDYCDVSVEFGPYRAETAMAAPNGAHEIPTGRDLEGVTIFLAGRAIKDDVSVDFALISGESSSTTMKIREGDGTPATFDVESGVGSFKVTIGKTYDRFFDGIDFATYDAEQETINGGLMPILIDETRGYRGTTIY